MELQDDIWKRDSPDRYALFMKWYGQPLISIHMAFLKRMRRHKNFPRLEYLAPVYDLDTGNIKMGFYFSIINRDNVSIIKRVPGHGVERFVVNDLNAAWDVYLKEIMVSM